MAEAEGTVQDCGRKDGGAEGLASPTCVGCEPRSARSAVIADEDVGLIHIHSLGIVEPAPGENMCWNKILSACPECLLTYLQISKPIEAKHSTLLARPCCIKYSTVAI